MSRTDKDRPYYVRAHDRLDTPHRRGVEHSARAHGIGVCDAHCPDNARDYRWTACRPHAHPTNRTAARKLGKKTRTRVDRAFARATTHDLLRSVHTGGLDEAEDRIDHHAAWRFPSCGCCF